MNGAIVVHRLFLRLLFVAIPALGIATSTATAGETGPLEPVFFQQIRLGGFWKDQAKRLTERWIPHCIAQIEEDGRGKELLNLVQTAKVLKGEPHGKSTGNTLGGRLHLQYGRVDLPRPRGRSRRRRGTGKGTSVSSQEARGVDSDHPRRAVQRRIHPLVSCRQRTRTLHGYQQARVLHPGILHRDGRGALPAHRRRRPASIRRGGPLCRSPVCHVRPSTAACLDSRPRRHGTGPVPLGTPRERGRRERQG